MTSVLCDDCALHVRIVYNVRMCCPLVKEFCGRVKAEHLSTIEADIARKLTWPSIAPRFINPFLKEVLLSLYIVDVE